MCAAYSNHGYYSRAAFISLRASDCAATIRGWQLNSPVILQEFPHPTLPHQLCCKSSHIMITSCSTSVSTSYTTSPVVLQEFPILHYLTSHPTRVPTSYTTSPSCPARATGCDQRNSASVIQSIWNLRTAVSVIILKVNLEACTHLHVLQTFLACMHLLHWATLCNICIQPATCFSV